VALKRFLAFSRALDDETRVRILAAVETRELCLCQLVELFSLAPSTLSRHVQLLTDAGLLERRKQGRWHYFRLAGRAAAADVRHTLRWALNAVRDDASVRGDAKRLRAILRMDPREMTACYRS
jgi:ArsR family transcriptional regulator